MSHETCARCGGQILNNYDERFCLQCGNDPDFKLPPTISSDNGAKPITAFPPRLLSSKPSQIRRRKRRLLIKGCTEAEAEKIVRAQTKGG